jgi:hypothetical protein
VSSQTSNQTRHTLRFFQNPKRGHDELIQPYVTALEHRLSDQSALQVMMMVIEILIGRHRYEIDELSVCCPAVSDGLDHFFVAPVTETSSDSSEENDSSVMSFESMVS